MIVSSSAGSYAVPPRPIRAEALLPAKLEKVGSVPRFGEGETERIEHRTEIQEAATKANAYLNLIDTKLQFKVSEQTGHVVVRVIDSETQEVIREIPPEKLHRFAEQFAEIRGLLFESTG